MSTLEHGGPPRDEAVDSLRSGPDPVPMHEPIWREMVEPRDGREPAPVWLVFLFMALLGWGGFYLGTYDFGFRRDVYDMSKPPTAGQAPSPQPPQVDPMVLGRRVFNNCMACHQQDGKGLPGTYPPLAGSELVQARSEVPVALVLHGLEGPVSVKGETYDNAMPSWKQLSDEQIAAVLTYERNSWGNSAPPITAEQVAAVRKQTAGRTQAWKAATLEEFRRDLPPPSSSGREAEAK
jgi:mono/diheme cytochrome c family protein